MHILETELLFHRQLLFHMDNIKNISKLKRILIYMTQIDPAIGKILGCFRMYD